MNPRLGLGTVLKDWASKPSVAHTSFQEWVSQPTSEKPDGRQVWLNKQSTAIPDAKVRIRAPTVILGTCVWQRLSRMLTDNTDTLISPPSSLVAAPHCHQIEETGPRVPFPADPVVCSRVTILKLAEHFSQLRSFLNPWYLKYKSYIRMSGSRNKSSPCGPPRNQHISSNGNLASSQVTPEYTSSRVKTRAKAGTLWERIVDK